MKSSFVPIWQTGINFAGDLFKPAIDGNQISAIN
jgi:hypothetical protein